MKKLANYFLQGLLFSLPIAATLYVIYRIFIAIDGILPFNNIPGLGIVIIVAGITILGYLSKFYFSNPVSNLLEKGIEKTPLVKLIYSSVKDLISAFVGEKKRFNQPVLVTVNNSPLIQRVGFITQNDLTEMGINKDKIAVYLPFSYGLNGELVIIDKDNIESIDASGTEMMKFVISGGVTEV
jgi:uncharacterized membrane protein